MKKIKFLFIVLLVLITTSCTENYSNGEKVGTLTDFAEKGLIFKSWEGKLNITQTGMNTADEPFEFSFDNDRDDQQYLIKMMKTAQVEGWKIKIKYHRVLGWNWFRNRGETNYFVTDVEVLDKDYANKFMTNKQ